MGWMSLLLCLPQVWYRRADCIALEGSTSGLLLLDGFRLVTDWLSLRKVKPVSSVVVDGGGKVDCAY